MINTELSRVHTTLLKTYRSPEYRKKIKRLVEAAKTFARFLMEVKLLAHYLV